MLHYTIFYVYKTLIGHCVKRDSKYELTLYQTFPYFNLIIYVTGRVVTVQFKLIKL